MNRTHFLLQTTPTDVGSKEQVLVMIEPGYKDAAEARKHLRELQPGVYHLTTFVEANINIKPPAVPTDNVIERGKTFVHRAPKAE